MKAVRIFLSLLFLAVTFNAYACLLPFYPDASEMSGKCSSSEEQPARQLCDAFKTLGIQNSSSLPPIDHHYFSYSNLDQSLTLSDIISNLPSIHVLHDDRFLGYSQSDLALRATVLRI